MEVRWLLLMGAWKTCVTLDLRYTMTPDHLSFFSWGREKCPLVCPSSSFPFSIVQPTDYFHFFSSNFLLGPIPAKTYSPNCIRHTIVENGSPVIVQWSNVLKKCLSLGRGDLPTSLWMLLMSVQLRLA